MLQVTLTPAARGQSLVPLTSPGVPGEGVNLLVESEAIWLLRLPRLPDVDPRMHVRGAAEVPEHVGAFDLPYVPDAVAADVQALSVVERHVQVVEAAGLDQLHRLVRVRLAERGEQVGQHPADEVPLVVRHLAEAQTGQTLLLAAQRDRLRGLLLARLAEQGDLALLSVERL